MDKAKNLSFLPLFVLLFLKGHEVNESSPLFLFSHGLAGTSVQGQEYAKKGIIAENFVGFEFPDSIDYQNSEMISNTNQNIKKWIYSIWIKIVRGNYNNSSLAQDTDINTLRAIYNQLINKEENKNSKIILVGLSRGASTELVFAALDQPSQVAAILAESPFKDIDSVLTLKREQFGFHLLPLEPNVIEKMERFIIENIFKQYDHNGIKPIDVIEKIDKNIPILFICSQKDTLVPCSSTFALYKKLRETGHDKVHIFVAKQGAHSKILQGIEAYNYVSVVHAFYKHYNLPYNEQLARHGAALFATCQPDEMLEIS